MSGTCFKGEIRINCIRGELNHVFLRQDLIVRCFSIGSVTRYAKIKYLRDLCISHVRLCYTFDSRGRSIRNCRRAFTSEFFNSNDSCNIMRIRQTVNARYNEETRNSCGCRKFIAFCNRIRRVNDLFRHVYSIDSGSAISIQTFRRLISLLNRCRPRFVTRILQYSACGLLANRINGVLRFKCYVRRHASYCLTNHVINKDNEATYANGYTAHDGSIGVELLHRDRRHKG